MIDLFDLLVVHVFGNIFLSGLGIAALMFFMGIIGRMSFNSILFVIGTFMAVFLTGYLGPIGIILLFIGAMVYFVAGVIGFINWIRS